MSIIYDALKKTQRKRMDADGGKTGEMPVRRKRLMAYSTYIILFNLGLIICLLAFAKIYNAIIDHKKVTLAKTLTMKEKVRPLLPTPDKFVVNGMFISAEEKFVVINNKTLHEGEIIDGAKVIRIETNKIVLSQYGKAFSLKSDLSPN